jgi:Na+-transporting NADH:ubiquinone oxidoreductase subunit C
MQRDGALYTFGFAAAVCFVCSALVCSAAVLLKERQELNQKLDRQKKVLDVAGLVTEGERLSTEQVMQRYEERIRPRLVDMRTGTFAEDASIDIAEYDPRRARDADATSMAAPLNSAGVERIPNYTIVYEVLEGGQVGKMIVPIEGKGLWSTLYGYLALDNDLRTIEGITFYEHGETPGLGGEVDNPVWKDRWVGRMAYDEEGVPRIRVKRGPAGPPVEDPFEVDGLAGATITSQGVTNMLRFWLGDDGLGPFLKNQRQEGG